MERKKQEILTRLKQLKEVSFVKPTAMDLHGKRAMLSRVQRQEQKRYKTSIENQKAKLLFDLKRVESYLEGLKRRNDYLAGSPIVLPKPKDYSEQRIGGKNLQGSMDYRESLRKQESYLKKAPEVSVQPTVVMRSRPVLRRTRLSRYERRRRRY